MNSPLTRPSLFPTYEPSADGLPMEHLAKWISAWARRILAVAGVVGVLAGGLTAVGFRFVTPKTSSDSVSFAIRELRDSVRLHGERLKNIEDLARSSLFISCATLKSLEPTAVPQQACTQQQQPPTSPP